MTYIVTHHSQKDLAAEGYDQARLHATVVRSLVAQRSPLGQAESFAKLTVAKVEQWLRDKTEITSRELRTETARALAEFDADAAYFYQTENQII